MGTVSAINVLLSIIIIVFGILQIILFFKMWKMCNDVGKSTIKLEKLSNFIMDNLPKAEKEQYENVSESDVNKYSVKQLVIIKVDENQFRIDDVLKCEDGKFLYFSSKYNKYFAEDEIEDFNEYWAAKNRQ